MEDLETSWGEVVISEAVATSVEVSCICIADETASALKHTNAGTFDRGVYMSIGVLSFASSLKN